MRLRITLMQMFTCNVEHLMHYQSQ